MTPELEHVLLADEGHIQEVDGGYSAIIPLVRGIRGRISQVRSVAKDVDVDLVHAHSSWAGAYARIGRPPRPVVYEPHCFVFDDPNRSRLQRWVYRKAEVALGRNTAVVIALTPHEQALAEGIAEQEKVIWLPNVPTIPVRGARKTAHQSTVFEVVMVGRLARQKDPLFFASLFKSIKDHGHAIKFTWIGDGETHYHKILTDHGVEVTGWLNDKDLVEKIGRASCRERVF